MNKSIFKNICVFSAARANRLHPITQSSVHFYDHNAAKVLFYSIFKKALILLVSLTPRTMRYFSFYVHKFTRDSTKRTLCRRKLNHKKINDLYKVNVFSLEYCNLKNLLDLKSLN